MSRLFLLSCISRIIFFLALRCASDIGAHRRLLSVSSSWNGLADTDSESAIFSSGLLALFYLRFCGAPFSSPRLCPQTALARLLSFPFLSPHAPIFFSLSPPPPPLPRIPSQILTYDYGQANV